MTMIKTRAGSINPGPSVDSSGPGSVTVLAAGVAAHILSPAAAGQTPTGIGADVVEQAPAGNSTCRLPLESKSAGRQIWLHNIAGGAPCLIIKGRQIFLHGAA